MIAPMPRIDEKRRGLLAAPFSINDVRSWRKKHEKGAARMSAAGTKASEQVIEIGDEEPENQPSGAVRGFMGFGGVSIHAMAEAFGAAVDAKDRHTAMHSQETAALSEALAMAMGLSANQTARVHLAAHLHDIGKIGVPEAILSKAGPLAAGEFDIIRTHPAMGARILRPCLESGAGSVLDMILRHHERYDGGGYPGGLAGRDIPLGARIIAVADSYSAMRQDRPYRKGMSHESALAEIERFRGVMYDPDAARIFLSNEKRMKALIEPRTVPPTHQTYQTYQTCQGRQAPQGGKNAA